MCNFSIIKIIFKLSFIIFFKKVADLFICLFINLFKWKQFYIYLFLNLNFFVLVYSHLKYLYPFRIIISIFLIDLLNYFFTFNLKYYFFTLLQNYLFTFLAFLLSNICLINNNQTHHMFYYLIIALFYFKFNLKNFLLFLVFISPILFLFSYYLFLFLKLFNFHF